MTFKKVQFMEALAVLSTTIQAQNLTIRGQEIEELSLKMQLYIKHVFGKFVD